MSLITDLFFWIGGVFKWSFETFLIPIGYYAGWFFTFIGCLVLVWWLKNLWSFGNENEKDYNGW